MIHIINLISCDVTSPLKGNCTFTLHFNAILWSHKKWKWLCSCYYFSYTSISFLLFATFQLHSLYKWHHILTILIVMSLVFAATGPAMYARWSLQTRPVCRLGSYILRASLLSAWALMLGWVYQNRLMPFRTQFYQIYHIYLWRHNRNTSTRTSLWREDKLRRCCSGWQQRLEMKPHVRVRSSAYA